MRFSFLLSDQHGDIELIPEDLDQPFLVSPSEKHPFLTLADYFGALQKFIMLDGGRVLLSALQGEQSLEDISEIIIRSEKHGAFYHIASVELAGLKNKIKYAVTTAVSMHARRSLEQEFTILQKLSGLGAELIPQIYCAEAITLETKSASEHFFMVLGEWLDNYHEWHVSTVPGSGEQKIQLWDYENGYRFLSDRENYELLRQAAFILSFYYDQESFQQIYPWHHGAGDFVARVEAGSIAVKLITARLYDPLVQFDRAEEADRIVAAIHFLLNLCLRMRLDRLDGVGEPAWLDDFAMAAAVEGFFDGLAAVEKQGRMKIGTAADFLELLRSFDAGEIYDMYQSLLAVYIEEDPDDYNLILAKLSSHTEELQKALQDFSLQKP